MPLRHEGNRHRVAISFAAGEAIPETRYVWLQKHAEDGKAVPAGRLRKFVMDEQRRPLPAFRYAQEERAKGDESRLLPHGENRSEKRMRPKPPPVCRRPPLPPAAWRIGFPAWRKADSDRHDRSGGTAHSPARMPYRLFDGTNAPNILEL
jgi:hypothetical protein